MYRTVFGIAFAALFGFGAVGQAQEKMTVESVVKKAIEASGGTDALKKYPGMRQKFKGSMEIGGEDTPFTGELAIMLPEKMKVSFVINAGGEKVKIVQTVNGSKVRTSPPELDKDMDETDKQELRESVVEHRVSLLYPLLEDKAFEVKLLDDKVKVEEGEAYVLTVKSKDLREQKLFIDAKTFLPVKTEKTGRDSETKKEGKEEEFLTDYKKVEGVMISMKSKVLFNGKPKMTIEVTEVKLVDKIPAGEFDISD